MKTYKMAVATEDPKTGRAHTEYTRHLTADQLDASRAAARLGASRGTTRTIKVTNEK